MKNEKHRIYQEVLTKYLDSCYGKEQDRKQFVCEYGEFLHDPEFLEMLQEDEECRKATAYLTRLTVDDVFVAPFIDALREFSQGTPIEFSDVDLQVLGRLYQEIPEFQDLCAADPSMFKAISYWLQELHRRASHDERFKARELLMKLRRFDANPSVEFSDSDLDLLNSFYQNDLEFQKICNEEVVVRKSLIFWLEERQRRTSKNSSES